MSTAASLVAIGCAVLAVCAPAIPFALGIASAAGLAAGVADGVLSAKDCVGKGNCSRLVADVALIALTSRLPSVRAVTRASRLGRTAGLACSFTAETRVLLGDGKSTKPISQIKPGDQVFAANPETGERGPGTVTATWHHRDTVVDLDIDGSVVRTTEDHPFWNATDHEYQRANQLQPGDTVSTADGRRLAVRGLRQRPSHNADAFNLSVNALHSYYVRVGRHAVLVHNTCGPTGPPALPSSAEAARLLMDAKPVGSALKADAWHRSASFVVDDVAASGSVFRTTGGDGVDRILIQMPGAVNGQAGRFEWILDNGNLTHQMFVRGGTINGVPIRR